MTIAMIMGVSGCGKTTIGRALAERLGWCFQEGDALHPKQNVAKMAAGIPLSDTDREPWLRSVSEAIRQWHLAGQSGVITCSALKRVYRDLLLGGLGDTRLVFLLGDRATIAARLASRTGHFMPPALLDSQLTILEPPTETERALIIQIDRPVADMVDELVVKL